MPRLVCLVRILEMPNRRSKAKDSQTRPLQNGGDVDGGNEEKRGTTAGHGGRAAPRGQAQGQAQGQAVAAGTSSRLSLLMPRPRAAGRDGEAHLLLRLCNLYILCESVHCFSVIFRGRTFERGQTPYDLFPENFVVTRARRALEPGGRLEPWAARARSLL